MKQSRMPREERAAEEAAQVKAKVATIVECLRGTFPGAVILSSMTHMGDHLITIDPYLLRQRYFLQLPKRFLSDEGPTIEDLPLVLDRLQLRTVFRKRKRYVLGETQAT